MSLASFVEASVRYDSEQLREVWREARRFYGATQIISYTPEQWEFLTAPVRGLPYPLTKKQETDYRWRRAWVQVAVPRDRQHPLPKRLALGEWI